MIIQTYGVIRLDDYNLAANSNQQFVIVKHLLENTTQYIDFIQPEIFYSAFIFQVIANKRNFTYQWCFSSSSMCLVTYVLVCSLNARILILFLLHTYYTAQVPHLVGFMAGTGSVYSYNSSLNHQMHWLVR